MSIDNAPAWKCGVCGYVHREGQAPGSCPVCGAPAELFESYAEPVAHAAAQPVAWRCLVCAYTHKGPERPAVCPVCGAQHEEFEAAGLEEGATAASEASVRALIVGAGIAGIAAAEALRAASPASEIVIVSREAELPYYRLNLTRYLAGEIGAADLPIHPESWYGENRIALRRKEEVVSFDLRNKTAALKGGEQLGFDKLVLAMGAHPFFPPFPGTHHEGVTGLRTFGDTERLLESGLNGADCVCIGGGILGLEAAVGLARRGAKVTVLEGFGWLLPRQLHERAGQILADCAAEIGITIRNGAKVKEIQGDERARGVLLEDGSFLKASVVLISAGVRPNTYLARQAGLEVNRGIVVDSRLAASHPDVLAAGDSAEWQGVLYGIWGPSQYQGAIAGMNAGGAGAEFAGIAPSNALKVLGLDLFSVGMVNPSDASYAIVEDESDGRCRRFVFRDTHLAGAVLLGDSRAAAAAKSAIESRADFSGVLAHHTEARDVEEFLLASSKQG